MFAQPGRNAIFTLREKCPNTEFFLVRIFVHSDWIRRDTESECGKIRTRKISLFRQFSRSVSYFTDDWFFLFVHAFTIFNIIYRLFMWSREHVVNSKWVSCLQYFFATFCYIFVPTLTWHFYRFPLSFYNASNCFNLYQTCSSLSSTMELYQLPCQVLYQFCSDLFQSNSFTNFTTL